MKINYGEYLEKVYGCWAGKNIGGTLGAPMEGKMAMNNVTFYTQELNGVPAPNDDLDLQLIWLAAVEINGIDQITPNLLGEYWHQSIIAPCSEYEVCMMNVVNGFMPPLSGAVNNDKYKYSNGAWIRSEIWACLCPGAPDQAIKYAYNDSCADHCEEGIWAEMFTAALEAAAFVEGNPRRLIEIALSKVPADSVLAKAVNEAIACYDKGLPWNETREKLMADFDIVEYRAAVNIGFVIIGLLYGEGDFDKSICTAVNCGDDTDCTGATVGALFGIMKGISNIPKRWLEPIGESISTVCINHFGYPFLFGLPRTLKELTERTAKAAIAAAAANPLLAQLVNGPGSVTEEELSQLDKGEMASRLLNLPLYYQDYQLQFATKLRVEYPEGPIAAVGAEVPLRLVITDSIHVHPMFKFRWKNLPQDWAASPVALCCALRADGAAAMECSITVGQFDDFIQDLELEVELAGRRQRQIVRIPFQLKDTTVFALCGESEQSYRCRTRIVAGRKNSQLHENAMPQL
ncbi:MAG: ADP-ribosylglycohydrolase family protein [Victivallales bacterium]|nr:ADP-ribosylglycohydrolase family protein [Victivallales bacterium]